MKIACLQFAPVLGEVEGNIRRANEVLARSAVGDLDVDILVLPELAFSGYNFPSLAAITPHLEPTAAGPSTRWAQRTAQTLHCIVAVGYPEDASAAPPSPAANHLPPSPTPTITGGTPVVPNADPDFPHNYNACVVVSPAGEVLAHYRKSFLYYTDATWAREGPGFWSGTLQLPGPFRSMGASSLSGATAETRGGQAGAGETIKAAIGICMDLNPRNFTEPWEMFEFGNHVLSADADVALVSMAWLSQDLAPEMVRGAEAATPDVHTLGYWLERFRPLREQKDGRTRVLVMANRCGVEGYVCYAGTSAVMGIRDGEAWIWDVCGKGEEKVLVVDTEQAPKYAFAVQKQQEHGERHETSDQA